LQKILLFFCHNFLIQSVRCYDLRFIRATVLHKFCKVRNLRVDQEEDVMTVMGIFQEFIFTIIATFLLNMLSSLAV